MQRLPVAPAGSHEPSLHPPVFIPELEDPVLLKKLSRPRPTDNGLFNAPSANRTAGGCGHSRDRIRGCCCTSCHSINNKHNLPHVVIVWPSPSHTVPYVITCGAP